MGNNTRTKAKAKASPQATNGLSQALQGHYEPALVQPGVIDSPIGRVDTRTISKAQADELVKKHQWPYLVPVEKKEE